MKEQRKKEKDEEGRTKDGDNDVSCGSGCSPDVHKKEERR